MQSACSLTRKITSGFTSDRTYRKNWRKLEAGNSYIKIHFARNRQASVSIMQAELHLLEQMIRSSCVSVRIVANMRYGANSTVRLSSVHILIERAMHHRLLHILYRTRAAEVKIEETEDDGSRLPCRRNYKYKWLTASNTKEIALSVLIAFKRLSIKLNWIFCRN